MWQILVTGLGQEQKSIKSMFINCLFVLGALFVFCALAPSEEVVLGEEQEPLCWDKLTMDLVGAENSIWNFNSLCGTRSEKKTKTF